jgi:hypothetical protein
MSEDPAPRRLERLRERAIGVIEAGGVARGDPAMVREAIRLTQNDRLDVVGLVRGRLDHGRRRAHLHFAGGRHDERADLTGSRTRG